MRDDGWHCKCGECYPQWSWCDETQQIWAKGNAGQKIGGIRRARASGARVHSNGGAASSQSGGGEWLSTESARRVVSCQVWARTPPTLQLRHSPGGVASFHTCIITLSRSMWIIDDQLLRCVWHLLFLCFITRHNIPRTLDIHSQLAASMPILIFLPSPLSFCLPTLLPTTCIPSAYPSYLLISPRFGAQFGALIVPTNTPVHHRRVPGLPDVLPLTPIWGSSDVLALLSSPASVFEPRFPSGLKHVLAACGVTSGLLAPLAIVFGVRFPYRGWLLQGRQQPTPSTISFNRRG